MLFNGSTFFSDSNDTQIVHVAQIMNGGYWLEVANIRIIFQERQKKLNAHKLLSLQSHVTLSA